MEVPQWPTAVLKAPATAQFPSDPSDYSILYDPEKDRAVIEGYVDAQNGFGALIRSRWAVRIVNPNGHRHLLSIRLDGKVVYNDPNVPGR